MRIIPFFLQYMWKWNLWEERSWHPVCYMSWSQGMHTKQQNKKRIKSKTERERERGSIFLFFFFFDKWKCFFSTLLLYFTSLLKIRSNKKYYIRQIRYESAETCFCCDKQINPRVDPPEILSNWSNEKNNREKVLLFLKEFEAEYIIILLEGNKKKIFFICVYFSHR